MREALQISEKPVRAVKDTAHIPPSRRGIQLPPTGKHPLDRALALLWPWERKDYPGRMKIRQWLLGVASVHTAKHYRQVDLPKIRRAFLADRLERKALEVLAFVAELRAGLPAAEPEKLTRKIVSPPVE
jgi:hypothetical protein